MKRRGGWKRELKGVVGEGRKMDDVRYGENDTAIQTLKAAENKFSFS